jgi:DNA-binding CsgD family transcriptional regulator
MSGTKADADRIRTLEGLREQAEAKIQETENRLAGNVMNFAMPHIKRLLDSSLTEEQRIEVIALKDTLKDIVAPFQRSLSSTHPNLTPKEIEVANLVRMGLTSKNIAIQLGTSKRAVEFHRDSVRRKLKLKKSGKNLRAYLASLG